MTINSRQQSTAKLHQLNWFNQIWMQAFVLVTLASAPLSEKRGSRKYAQVLKSCVAMLRIHQNNGMTQGVSQELVSTLGKCLDAYSELPPDMVDDLAKAKMLSLAREIELFTGTVLADYLTKKPAGLSSPQPE